MENIKQTKSDVFDLLSWYHKTGRTLPWRSYWPLLTPAYHVFLSEFMLQQTGVKTVIPYFEYFLDRWPTIQLLADAPVDDVTSAWAGLGYYARARNMHKSAQIISNAGGVFPQSIAELTKLPGIGPYTAGAITAFAFDAPSVVIDGNIERIVARYFYIKTSLPALKSELPSFYEKMIPEKCRSDFPQALMDLGNEICTPSSPTCGRCPLSTGCKSAKKANPALLPIKPVKTNKIIRKGHIFVIRKKEKNNDKFLVYRRNTHGLLGGLLAFPSQGWDDKEQNYNENWRPCNLNWTALKPKIKHVFSHFKTEVQVFLADTEETDKIFIKHRFQNFQGQEKEMFENHRWVTEDELHLPKLMQKALKLVKNYN